MTTQKTFKRRVRQRMTKTGESYTSARRQLLHKADTPDRTAPASVPAAAPVDPAILPTSGEALLRATGRSWSDWFADLDEWGGTSHRHSEIAGWLASERGVQPWWTQAITVGYERARGLRSQHEMPGGFQVSANRTIAADPARVLEAFTDPDRRGAWLPGVGLTQRRTTAAGTARFDWPDPPSRLVVWATAKGDGRTAVSVMHEKLPDAEAAARLKASWRERLGALKRLLEEA